MRKLKTSDIFAFSRCLTTIGVKEEISKIAEGYKKGGNIEQLGIDILYRIFELAGEKKAEQAIYDFLSQPFEISPDQVAELPIDMLFEKIQELVSDGKTLASFFKAVLR